MQAQMAAMAAVPDVLKQLIYDPVALQDAQPVNATEASLSTLIDDKLRVKSAACVPKFLHILQHAKTEADEALVLVILRATATGAEDEVAEACTTAFEKCGGLKITKKWLREAVEWNYSDLLVLLLDVLKVLPVQLTSITEARINEPIVKLRKEAQEEKVRRAAQDLLKHWRTRFTEKDKAKAPSPKNASSTTPKPSTTTTATTSLSSAPPKTAAEAAVSEAKALKKRPLKRLPTASGSSTAASTSKSSELIGNLMQRKSAKDAAGPAKPKKETESNKLTSSSETSSPPDGGAHAAASNTDEIVMQLPAIQSFKAVATTSSAATKSNRIRWADEHGQELTKVKLIESWRDMIQYHPQQDENSFKDAKLREHEAERQMMKSHKEREAFHVEMAHAWTTPAMVKLPEALAMRRAPVVSAEADAQSTRTRREMEFMVLDGEVPPVSPKEWTRSNEPHRGPPKAIPLLDVDAAAAAAAAAAQQPHGGGSIPGETEDERALREALGPLERSTIALLMDNERVLPLVYEEAQRNGNRIADSRVVEIVDFHRRQGFHHAMGPPPPHHHQRYGGGGLPPPPQQPQAYDSGYSKYGGGGGFHGGPPPPQGYEFNHPPPFGGPPMMHHASHKRKAPGAGLHNDMAPPAKRMVKRGPNGVPLQCMYFMQPGGCKHGANCQFAHEMMGGPPMAHGGGGGYGPPPGGRFGHQPPMGMRGGGGMRGMHGGR